MVLFILLGFGISGWCFWKQKRPCEFLTSISSASTRPFPWDLWRRPCPLTTPFYAFSLKPHFFSEWSGEGVSGDSLVANNWNPIQASLDKKRVMWSARGVSCYLRAYMVNLWGRKGRAGLETNVTRASKVTRALHLSSLFFPVSQLSSLSSANWRAGWVECTKTEQLVLQTHMYW